MITFDQIESADAELKTLKQKVDALKQQYAEQECPYILGQVVKVVGSPYKAHVERDMVVSRIMYDDYSKSWVATGHILKKDGSKGLFQGRVSAFNLEYEEDS